MGLTKISKKVLIYEVSNQCPDLVCKKEGWIPLNVCQLLWVQLTHHQELIFATFGLGIIGSTQSCQGVHHIKLHGAYNLVCIRKGDEWKPTFRTCYKHFKYVVMHFGLINALAIFQHFMNDVFREYLNDFVVCYIDDILIFSKNLEKHEHHFNMFWTSQKNLHFMPNWKNVNSIKQKWNSQTTSFLKVKCDCPTCYMYYQNTKLLYHGKQNQLTTT